MGAGSMKMSALMNKSIKKVNKDQDEEEYQNFDDDEIIE